MFARRTRRLAVAAAFAATLAVPATASAAVSSFDGTCRLGGNVNFDKGVTNENRQNSARVDLDGPCTGEANGMRLSGARGRYEAVVSGVVGCFGSRGPLTGDGKLTILRGAPMANVVIPIKAGLLVTTPTGELTARGDRSGSARGEGNFLGRTMGDQMARCPSDGLKTAGFDVDLKTASPLTAGAEDRKTSVRLGVSKTVRGATARRAGGIPVRCAASDSGTCTVIVKRRSDGLVIARGSAPVNAGRKVTVLARLTRAGRAATRGRDFRAVVEAASGGSTASKSIVVR